MPPSDKEKQLKQQEKYQAILSAMLRDEDNKYCVDCDSKGPRWASWNLGVFLCIRCAGIHRNLGVHISRVKSVNLDSWTAEQIASIQAMGNSRARAVYEANLPDNFRRSQTDSAMEQFIRQKYEQRKWIAKEWIPPNITISPDLTDDEKGDKRKQITNKSPNDSTGAGKSSSDSVKLNLNVAASSNKKTNSTATASSTKQQQHSSSSSKSTKPVTFSEQQTKTNDLVNLFDLNDMTTSLPISNTNTTSSKGSASAAGNNLLDDDLFANFTDSNLVQSNNILPLNNNNNNDNNYKSNNRDDLKTLMTPDTSSSSLNAKIVDKSSILALYNSSNNNNSGSSTASAAAAAAAANNHQSNMLQQQLNQPTISYQSQLGQLLGNSGGGIGAGNNNSTFLSGSGGIPNSNSQQHFNLNMMLQPQTTAQSQQLQKNQLFSDLNQLNMNAAQVNKASPMMTNNFNNHLDMFNNNNINKQNNNNNPFQANFSAPNSMYNLAAAQFNSVAPSTNQFNFSSTTTANKPAVAATSAAATNNSSILPNIGNTMSTDLWQ